MTQTVATQSELSLITAAQTALTNAKAAMNTAKSELNNAAQACADLMAIEKTAGRTDAYNAAFRYNGQFNRLRGETDALLGETKIVHADSSDAILSFFSNAGPIVMAIGR